LKRRLLRWLLFGLATLLVATAIGAIYQSVTVRRRQEAQLSR
jgi:hypothetical protein